MFENKSVQFTEFSCGRYAKNHIQGFTEDYFYCS
jgi:hypothetical protein